MIDDSRSPDPALRLTPGSKNDGCAETPENKTIQRISEVVIRLVARVR
jgi:hypothetical protein